MSATEAPSSRERAAVHFEALAARLTAAETAHADRATVLAELRDELETVHSSEYDAFLRHLIPAFGVVLQQLTGPQEEDNAEHRARRAVLEMLNRLPRNETLRPYLELVLNMCQQVLDADDAEGNGTLALHIMFELHKAYRTSAPQFVKPFVDFAVRLYGQFDWREPESVVVAAGAAAASPTDEQLSVHSRGEGEGAVAGRSTRLVSTLRSYKTVIECPLVFVHMAQLYARQVEALLDEVVPLMVRAIEVQVPPTSPARQHSSYEEFITAQMKTVSLISHLLKQFEARMEPYKERVPRAVVQLLVNCPDAAVAVRRELLIAMRHILASKFRDGFAQQTDLLLDEKVLLGTGRAAYESLRPLAYSFLAELVHFVRLRLSLPQLSRIVYLFASNVHDSSLSHAMQTTSVRLLLNLIEGIINRRDDADGRGRQLLQRIFETITTKLIDFGAQVPDALQNPHLEGDDPDARAEALKELADRRQLVRTLVLGLKTVVWSMSNALGSNNSNSKNSVQHRGLDEDECILIGRMLPAAKSCYRLYAHSDVADQREILDQFAQVFTMMNPGNFQDVIGLRMAKLFDLMVEHPVALSIPQHFLANTNTSKYFADVLIVFLTTHMDEVVGEDRARASVLLRLFKIMFASVTLFADNEPVLRPHLSTIVGGCVRLAGTASDPTNALQVLRALFKSLAGGRFELLYREFMPLLYSLLKSLQQLRDGPLGSSHDALLIELCLTVPARPSTIFPYLRMHMRPLVDAMEQSAELASLSFRTLEFWVDTLQPDVLERLVHEVEPGLSRALWRHLAPGNAFSSQAARIVGKLGGHNRNVPQEVGEAEMREAVRVLHARCEWENADGGLTLTLDEMVLGCRQALLSQSPHRDQAYVLLRSVLVSLLGDRGCWRSTQPTDAWPASSFVRATSLAQLQASAQLARQMLVAVIVAAGDAQINEEHPMATDFCRDVAEYFARCWARPRNVDAATIPPSSSPEASADAAAVMEWVRFPAYLDTECFVEALVEAATLLPRSLASFVPACLEHFLHVSLTCLGYAAAAADERGEEEDVADSDHETAAAPPVMPSSALPRLAECLAPLVERLSHLGYRERWESRDACAALLAVVIRTVPLDAFLDRSYCLYEARLVRVLVHVLKGCAVPGAGAVPTAAHARDALERLLRRCHPSGADATVEGDADRTARFGDVVACLAFDLASEHAVVRDTVQERLRQLVPDAPEGTLTSALMLCWGQILRPLLLRRARTLPYAAQVGHFECAAYCLEQAVLPLQLDGESSVLKTNLLAALEIVEDANIGKLSEADDLTVNKLIENRFMDAVVPGQLVQVRATCLRFLLITLRQCEALANGATEEARTLYSRVVAAFFRAIDSRHERVVEQAKRGLRVFADRSSPLPRGILSTNLRPILQNLSDTSRLTLPYVRTLANVLEVLSNWFNIQLGDKLLEHLVNLQAANDKTPSLLVANIVDLFHLLPSTSVRFMEQLVKVVLALEEGMGAGGLGAGHLGLRGRWAGSASPYRAPLLRYLERHPAAAVEFFLERLRQPRYGALFQVLVRARDASGLRTELASDPERLVRATFGDGSALEGAFLVDALAESQPGWLAANRVVFESLLRAWESPERLERLRREETLPVEQLQESRVLVKNMIAFCSANHDEIDALFAMLSIFSLRTLTDFSFLKRFLGETLPSVYPMEAQRRLLQRFLQRYADARVDADSKLHALQHLIIPLLRVALERGRGTELLDAATVETVVNTLLVSDDGANESDVLGEALLQLSTLLIEKAPAELTPYRKQVLTFGWSHLKRDDSAAKPWAFLNAARFFEAYQAPERIVLQVYVALLRAGQVENRRLVRQALDVLTGALQVRFASSADDPRHSLWMRFTRKILAEESFSASHLAHVLGVIVRHESFFAAGSATLIPHMVDALPRLTSSSVSARENRRLAVDLAAVLLQWQRALSAESSESGRPLRFDGARVAEVLSQFLVRLPFLASDTEEHGDLFHRCTALLEAAHSLRCALSAPPTPDGAAPPVTRIAALDRLVDGLTASIASHTAEAAAATTSAPGAKEAPRSGAPRAMSESRLTILANLLELCERLARLQGPAWVVTNQQTVVNLAKPAVRAGSLYVARKARDLYRTALEQLAPAAPEWEATRQALYAALLDTPPPASDVATVHHALLLLTLVPLERLRATGHEFLIRCLQRLLKESVNMNQTNRRQAVIAAPEHDRATVEQQVGYVGGFDRAGDANPLLTCLTLLEREVRHLGERRKTFFQFLWILIDKSLHAEVLSHLIRLIGRWVLLDVDSPEAVLVAREKVNFLVKMTLLERVQGAGRQQEELLQLVYGLFAEPNRALPRELLPKLERPFMIGLRSPVTRWRRRFFELLDQSVQRSPRSRLRYIIEYQSWGSLADSYWIRQAAELLLSVVRLPTAEDHGGLCLFEGGAAAFMGGDADAFGDAALAAVLGRLRAVSPCDALLGALRELLHRDVTLAHALWVQLFGAAWAQLRSAAARLACQDAFVSLLSKDYMLTQSRWRVNVMQPLVEGATSCRPQMVLPPQLMLHIAARWNAWHLVLPYLERRTRSGTMGVAQHHDFCYDVVPSVEELEEVMDAKAELYRRLNEFDLYIGLWKRRAVDSNTLLGLSLEQQGYGQQAQEVYFGAMAHPAGGAATAVTASEAVLWEERWMACAKQLNQWDALSEYARSVVHIELLHETLWRLPDWAALKELLIKAPPEDGPQLKVLQAYVQLQENKLREAETQVSAGVYAALEGWQGLPESGSIAALEPTLAQLQQLVELRESAAIVHELNQCQNDDESNLELHIDNIRQVLAMWRDRLPNEWDALTVWNELVVWRSHVLTAVVHAFQNLRSVTAREVPQPILCLGINETAWNVNRFSRAARKQRQPEVCLQALQRLYTHSTMDVQDFFMKTKQQAKAYLLYPLAEAEDPWALRSGLAQLQATNLEYFNARQKAHLFSLKGEFFHRLGMHDEANKAFATAVGVHAELGGVWLRWGHLCDDRGWRTSAVNCYLQSIRFGSRRGRDHIPCVLRLLFGSAVGGAEVMEEAAESMAAAVDSFERFLAVLPPWVWIPWCAYFVGLLARHVHPRAVRHVLVRLAQYHPQALFFTLRMFLEERRAVDRPQRVLHPRPDQVPTQSVQPLLPNAAGYINLAALNQRAGGANGGGMAAGAAPAASEASGSGAATAPTTPASSSAGAARGPNAAPTSTTPPPTATTTPLHNAEASVNAMLQVAAGATPFENADVVMAFLARQHPQLYVELETITRELSMRLKPSAEEQVLHVLNALLHRCWSLPPLMRREVGAAMRNALEEVSKMCFGTGLMSDDFTIPPSLVDLREAFEAELAPQTATDFPTVIEPFVALLRKWRGIFRRRVHGMPRVLRLERVSRKLVDVYDSEVLVFGQLSELAETDGEPLPELSVRIQRFSVDVEVVQRRGGSARRIAVTGSDGRRYAFLVETAVGAASAAQKSEARVEHACAFMNRLLERDTEARRRRLVLRTPRAVPLGAQARLLADDTSAVAMAEALAAHCEAHGGDMDDALIEFRDYCALRLEELGGQVSRDQALAYRFEAYKHVCRRLPDSVLSQWAAASVAHPNLLFALRKRLAQSMGAAGLWLYFLGVGGRSPANLLMSRATGLIIHAAPQVMVQVTEGGPVVHFDEFVPFRLTRNIRGLITLTGVEGVLAGSLAATLNVILRNQRTVLDWLRVHYAAELFDKASTSSASMTVDGMSLQRWVERSVELALKRIEPMPLNHPRQVASGMNGEPAAMEQPMPGLQAGTAAAAAAAAATANGAEANGSATPSATGRAQPLAVDQPDGVAHKAAELIAIAGDPSQTSQMEPLWYPWF
ncbi:hypothetical protein CDCA_CDCA15G4047 [Cyanidium caldarium]|uniref:Non-specific serine/threonine protein kinase n=1 Tax=Cyanidium caldarium TaxID=2771 RepID=A0AAV9J0A8_CYACA|nr:hypothetical protein CDCA_CDCA15G4047 [Cyanidium caldarium]